MLVNNFAYRVRLARGAAGFTQRDLAEAVGVHAKSVSAWERGKKKEPRAYTLQRLCLALRTNPEWLMYGQGKGPAVSINNALPADASTR